MKKIINFTAQFQGSIEVDLDQYPDQDIEDILYSMTHKELFAACETDLDLEVDSVDQ